jgi:sec-independent protein translocase protein TatC
MEHPSTVPKKFAPLISEKMAPGNNSESTKRLSLVEHLTELRNRLLVSIGAWLAASILSSYFLPQLYQLLLSPIRGTRVIHLITLAPMEGMITSLKLAMFGGVVLVVPVILIETWLFLAPALRRSELTVLKYLCPAGLIFFGGGVAFAYFLLLPLSLRIGLMTPVRMIEPFLGISQYFSFVTTLLGISGFLFELPLVLAGVCRLGLFNPEGLRRRRGYALLAGAILAAILTPTTDAVTLLLLMAPLAILYEIGIWLGVILIRHGRKELEY